MSGTIGKYINEASNQGTTLLGILLDPDELVSTDNLLDTLNKVNNSGFNLILIGGSLILKEGFDQWVSWIKENTDLPIILFPGSPLQLTDQVDGTLFLSLISGRNPDLLIGQQVIAAPKLKRSGVEVLPTGYMLVDGGAPTTASYMSHTHPIPSDKPDIATATAIAGELLGLDHIYLDAGSGASKPVPPKMIQAVASNIDVPLIVGGGMKNPEDLLAASEAGADVLVVGNALEDSPEKIIQFGNVLKETRS